ncbi:MAG: ABC transporter permease subunit [Cyanobacteria bacterium P01_G01_bin.54]
MDSPWRLSSLLNPFDFYTVPLDDWINQAIDFIVTNFRPVFQLIRLPIAWVLSGIQENLLAVPPLILLLFLGLIAWQLAGWKIGLFSLLSLTALGFVGVWEQSMITLSLVVTALIFCIVVGIPLGIICARNNQIESWIRPLLDAMQSIPAFVYLIPVVMLFGIGEVPGVIATIIYAIPPLIRLTNLGIRQVPKEVVEAALAFGSTPRQVLWEAQLPLAMPSILAGVNQTVLFALSMSVITAMIAVPGLGLMVIKGVGRLDVGLSAVGGLGIVLLAIVLDRITQKIGQFDRLTVWYKQGGLGLILDLVHRWRFGKAKG